MRVLELYSGLGGMRLGLTRALPPAAAAALHVTAVDINVVANAVYARNFGAADAPPLALSLEHASAAQLAAPEARLWTLSPPCQPFSTTSNSKRRDDSDARSASLLRLLDLLPQLPQPPDWLLLENVVGFHGSRCWARWAATLDALGYQRAEVVLCPTQLGVPYRRPRYFALAKRGGGFSPAAEELLQALALPGKGGTSQPPRLLPGRTPRVVGDYLEQPPSADDEREGGANAGPADHGWWWSARYALPPALLQRYWGVLDVVTPSSGATNCFTKGYGRNVLGAGSVLASDGAAARLCRADERGRLQLKGPSGAHDELRFYSPREVANLHGIPPWFSFPDHVTDRQRWQLLGNSLSVDVAALLFQCLLDGEDVS